MYCSNCGKKLSDDDFFCSNCGTPVSRQGLFEEETVTPDNHLSDLKEEFDLNETRLFNPELLKEPDALADIPEIPVIYFSEEDIQENHIPLSDYFSEHDIEEDSLLEDEKKSKKNFASFIPGFLSNLKKEKSIDLVETDSFEEDEADSYDESISLKKIMVPVIIIGIIIGLVLGMIMVQPWHKDAEPTATQGTVIVTNTLK